MAGTWKCHLCHQEETVARTTEGVEFVLHFCKKFGGKATKDTGVSKRTYLDKGVEVTVFPRT